VAGLVFKNSNPETVAALRERKRDSAQPQ